MSAPSSHVFFPSSSSKTGTNDEDMAAKLIEAIKSETVGAKPMYRKADMEKAIETLLDAAPARSGISFEQVKSTHPKFNTPTKNDRAPAIGDSDDIAEIENLFCMGHGGFTLISATSIEHGTAYTYICHNIDNFLSYLNKPGNKKIKDIFLKDKMIRNFFNSREKQASVAKMSQDDAKAIDMKKAVEKASQEKKKLDKTKWEKKWDNDWSKVKATSYLYRASYNNLNNLWLLCQACNNGKGKKPGLTWFKDQEYFGERFITDVENEGGLQKGIIFDLIPNSLSKMENIPGFSKICIGGTGFGEYTHDWFLENNDIIFDKFKALQTGPQNIIREKIRYLNEMINDGDDNVSKESRGLDSLLKRLSTIANVEPTDHSNSSSSDSETSSQGEILDKSAKNTVKNNKDRAHYLNSLERFLYKKYPKKQEKIHTFLNKQLEKSVEGHVPVKDVKKLRRNIKSLIEAEIKENDKKPKWSKIKEEIRKGIVSEMDKTKAAEEEVERERQARIASDKEKIAAEQRAAAAEQALAKLEAQIKRKTVSNSGSPSSSFTGNKRTNVYSSFHSRTEDEMAIQKDDPQMASQVRMKRARTEAKNLAKNNSGSTKQGDNTLIFQKLPDTESAKTLGNPEKDPKRQRTKR